MRAWLCADSRQTHVNNAVAGVKGCAEAKAADTALRELDRERTKLEQSENKLIMDIKSAKAGQLELGASRSYLLDSRTKMRLAFRTPVK